MTPFYPQWHQDFFTEEFWNQQVELNLQVFFHYKSLKLFIYPQINLNKIIDTINFHNFIGGVSCSCTLGYSLAEQEQGKGYMTEALTVAIAYLFKELDMHRIMANYMQGKRI
ncbi:Ribosomal-protein-S5p-alanine acetyltransferase [Richelia intracellularis]|nr:Ribosomal-protein-S5p-alanine acetyltransferase [Richelia intracellularis]